MLYFTITAKAGEGEAREGDARAFPELTRILRSPPGAWEALGQSLSLLSLKCVLEVMIC